ncbi:MAG TPA: iron ABC transporter permease, partial [Dehalococcoidia bacterium]|nr:iron ABC transporter permease [Dehalococcoidia bacterium]
MRRSLLLLALFGSLLALLACAAEEKATPAPAGPTAATKAAWELEWDRVVEAAKKEGKVAVAGPAGADVRE